ncbi:MAG: Calx-beta domain-containing protein, partial [bacterium]
TLGTRVTATLTIVDDTLVQHGIISFSANSYSINEDNTSINPVTLIRTNGNDGTVTVTLTPTNGTATAPGDFDNTPITITFGNGETSKTVTIPIVNDAIFESNETVTLTLSSPTGGATLGTPVTATLTIVSDDAAQPGIISFT